MTEYAYVNVSNDTPEVDTIAISKAIQYITRSMCGFGLVRFRVRVQMGECAHLDVSEDTRDENDCDEDNTQVEIVIGRVRVVHLHSVPVCLFLCFCVCFFVTIMKALDPKYQQQQNIRSSLLFVTKQKKWSYRSRIYRT